MGAWLPVRACGRVWSALTILVALATAGQARAQCDPLESAKLVAADGAPTDEFGYQVAISGDTAIVGAWHDDYDGFIDVGAVYVFVRSGGVWAQQCKLTASDGANTDYFGSAVALDGDTAVVGAYGGNVGTGAVYVFVRSGDTWAEQAKLTASDGAATDCFGISVAIAGDSVVIGSDDDDNDGGLNAGSAYVFVQSGSTWSQQAKLTAADAAQSDHFGYSVAIAPDTALVGATHDDNEGGTNAGAAYVFVRSGTGWTQQIKLHPSDPAPSEYFGQAVDLDGDTALIGAFYDDNAGGTNAGAAYVFVRSGGIWRQQAKLVASDGAAYDRFGYDVALDGDTALIGSLYVDLPGATDAGAAYVFTRSVGTWTQQAKIVASDGAASDCFGNAVALDGDTALVGVAWDDLAGEVDAGSAYVFFLPCNNPCPGDLNCDGVVDFGDINPFVMILSNFALWQQTYPGCPSGNGDIDGNGSVGFEDINPFVALLSNGMGGCTY